MAKDGHSQERPPRQRHYLEQELRERFRSDPEIFDFVREVVLDGIWFWDLEKPTEEWMSPGFKKLLGYREEEAPDSSAWRQERIHPEDLSVFLRSAQEHCSDPSHAYDQTVRYRHKNGSTIWVRSRGVVVRDPSGKPIRMLGAHQNVTRLKTAKDRLRRRTADLVASNLELESFAFAASHDLREPLRTLISYSSLLRQDIGEDCSEDVAQDLGFIVKAANRMERLVDDLLALSRVGRRSILMERLDLEECVQESLDGLHQVLSDSRAEVRRDELPVAVGDRALVVELFQGLISNSIKFARPGVRPRVRVTAERVGDEWAFGVKDNGVGIDRRHAERVFEPFERLNGLQEFDGSGIGLAICKRAAERQGGRIWLDEQPDVGAHVKFTLAKAKEASDV